MRSFSFQGKPIQDLEQLKSVAVVTVMIIIIAMQSSHPDTEKMTELITVVQSPVLSSIMILIITITIVIIRYRSNYYVLSASSYIISIHMHIQI